MKNVVKISISVAMIAVAALFFGGCSKDDNGPSLVSGGFDGTVTANVDGAGLMINAVLAVNDAEYNSYSGDFYGNDVGEAALFKNGSFTIKLPTSGLNSYLEDVTDFFEGFMKAGDKGNLKVSDPSARIMDVDFFGFYVDGDDVDVSGIFSYATSDKKTTCLFVYVNNDVNVTGGANVSVSLKRGWNRVYLSDKLTTKAPDGLKWYFEYFD